MVAVVDGAAAAVADTRCVVVVAGVATKALTGAAGVGAQRRLPRWWWRGLQRRLPRWRRLQRLRLQRRRQAYGYKGGGRDHGYHDGHKKHYGSYGNYRRYGYYGYGLPYISYGYGSGCGWLYRNAVNSGNSYWWNRYYECIGYY